MTMTGTVSKAEVQRLVKAAFFEGAAKCTVKQADQMWHRSNSKRLVDSL